MTIDSRVLLFLAIVVVVALGSHAYLGQRLISPLGLSPGWRRLAWAVVLLLALSLPATFVLLPLTGRPGLNGCQTAGYVYMGVFSTLLLLLLARDLLWLVLRGLDALRASGSLLPQDPGRRRFLAIGVNVALVGAAGVGAAVGYVQARRRPALWRLRLPVKDLPPALEGFRIAQVSDIHVGPTVGHDRLTEIVEQVNALEPDMVALTGDLVDGSVAGLRERVAPIADLRSRHGTFFVTGNHEYFSGAVAWCEHLTSLGLRVLNDAHEVIDHDGGRVLVAGVTDVGAPGFVPEHVSDPARAAADAPATDVRLLLAHHPKSAHAAAAVGFDLQLSGHTHGGQYAPFTWVLRAALPFVAGLYRHAEMWLYVNRGTAWWGPPNRLWNDTEVTLIELVRAEMDGARPDLRRFDGGRLPPPG